MAIQSVSSPPGPPGASIETATPSNAPAPSAEAKAAATDAAANVVTPASTQQLSTASLFLGLMQVYENKRPDEAKAFLQGIADKLRTGAEHAGAFGPSLNAWADRFQKAADSGDLSSLVRSSVRPSANFGVRAYQAAQQAAADPAALDAVMRGTLPPAANAVTPSVLEALSRELVQIAAESARALGTLKPPAPGTSTPAAAAAATAQATLAAEAASGGAQTSTPADAAGGGTQMGLPAAARSAGAQTSLLADALGGGAQTKTPADALSGGTKTGPADARGSGALAGLLADALSGGKQAGLLADALSGGKQAGLLADALSGGKQGTGRGARGLGGEIQTGLGAALSGGELASEDGVLVSRPADYARAQAAPGQSAPPAPASVRPEPANSLPNALLNAFAEHPAALEDLIRSYLPPPPKAGMPDTPDLSSPELVQSTGLHARGLNQPAPPDLGSANPALSNATLAQAALDVEARSGGAVIGNDAAGVPPPMLDYPDPTSAGENSPLTTPSTPAETHSAQPNVPDAAARSGSASNAAGAAGKASRNDRPAAATTVFTNPAALAVGIVNATLAATNQAAARARGELFDG